MNSSYTGDAGNASQASGIIAIIYDEKYQQPQLLPHLYHFARQDDHKL
jgi:hypothetical protein